MSNYHVLEVNDKQDRATVAFHIGVPSEINAVSVNLRTAIVQHLAPESQVPFVDSSEQTQIANGEIYEHIEHVEFNAHLTLAEKRTIIDNRYTVLASSILDKIRSRYEFYGLSRDVA